MWKSPTITCVSILAWKCSKIARPVFCISSGTAFHPRRNAWLAELADGPIEGGALTDVRTMAVSKVTRWVAQFDPESKRSVLCCTPKVITGTRSASLIWDLDRYHKYYLCQNRGQKFMKGEVLDYTVLMKSIDGESGDWVATKLAVPKLKVQFPPME
jgi:hypothetical protein